MDLARQNGSSNSNPERRATVRQRVFKGATLTYNRGFGALECTVRNQSDSGARLSLGETIGLPPQFELTIAGEQPRSARVIWRSMIAAGVAFD